MPDRNISERVFGDDLELEGLIDEITRKARQDVAKGRERSRSQAEATGGRTESLRVHFLDYEQMELEGRQKVLPGKMGQKASP